MEPENYNNEMNVNVEATGATASEKMKAELRESINKQYRNKSILYLALSAILAGLELWDLFHMCCYTCPCSYKRYAFIAIILILVVWGIYSAIVFRRIRRSGTAHEMKQHLNHYFNNEKYAFFAMWLAWLAHTYLDMVGNSQWYEILLAMVLMTAFVAFLIWLTRRPSFRNYGHEKLEKLLALEEESADK